MQQSNSKILFLLFAITFTFTSSKVVFSTIQDLPENSADVVDMDISENGIIVILSKKSGSSGVKVYRFNGNTFDLIQSIPESGISDSYSIDITQDSSNFVIFGGPTMRVYKFDGFQYNLEVEFDKADNGVITDSHNIFFSDGGQVFHEEFDDLKKNKISLKNITGNNDITSVAITDDQQVLALGLENGDVYFLKKQSENNYVDRNIVRSFSSEIQNVNDYFYSTVNNKNNVILFKRLNNLASQVSSSMLTAQGITSVSLSKNLQYKVAVSPTEGYIHDNPVNGSGDFIQQVIGGYNTIFSKNGRFLLVQGSSILRIYLNCNYDDQDANSYAFNNNSRTCSSCDIDGCVKCANQGCETCNQSQNYFVNSDRCSFCGIKNCAVCESLTICKRCSPGYRFNARGNVCVPNRGRGCRLSFVIRKEFNGKRNNYKFTTQIKNI